MKFLCALCVLCGLVVSSPALDREAFTFTKYNLDVHIEPEQQRLGVRGKITLRNDSSVPQKNIALQISHTLTWRSIQFEGKPVQFVSQTYTSDIDHTGSLSEAIVTLPQEIPPGKTLELEIGYEGTVPYDSTRLTRIGMPGEMAARTDWDQIGSSFTAVRGIGYVAWYPIATEAANLSEKNSVFDTVGRWKAREVHAEMNFNLDYIEQSAEALPSLLCNGKEGLIADEAMGRNRELRTACSFAPVGLTVPVLVIGRYAQTSAPLADIYFFPEHKNIAEVYAASAEKVRGFVSEWFGAPREKIVIAELPSANSLPFESGTLLLTPLNPDSAKQPELTAVRQLTHAAFLSPRPWISEGLTHFAQAAYREQQDRREAALEFMKVHAQVMLDNEKENSSASNEKSATQNSLINTWSEDLYRGKAMYVWWMLRDMVGESNLKKMLTSYHPEQDKDPSYVQHLLEAQSKKDLEWFFDDWVYRDKGLPDFRVQSVYPRKTLKDTYLVAVTVENLGNAAAEVPVIVRFKGGESTERVQVAGKSHATVRVTTPAVPEVVTVNDGSVPESDMSNDTFKVEVATDSR